MTFRIFAIALIYLCTTVAWAILSGTIAARTGERTERLRDSVASTWGSPHRQVPPRLIATEALAADPAAAVVPLEPAATRIDARIDLEHRRKGLLWYSTYGVDFTADYTFRHEAGAVSRFEFELPLPAKRATYDDVSIRAGGVVVPHRSDSGAVLAPVTLAPGESTVVRVHYRSRGLDAWEYALGSSVAQVRDFSLRLHTNFRNVDFPENTLSPTSRRREGPGWELRWEHRSLLSGVPIALAMPEKRQPGPLAARVSLFAPVSLLFFFFVMWLITTLRRIELHPMNYFFLATAFFAFHLLLAYTADLLPLEVAFAICSLVSVALVVSYLRLVVGARFALVEAGLAQLVYLVLFSYAFFFEGLTGLTVTIGSILTLFLAMQLTGRMKWSERFAPAPRVAPAGPGAPR